VADPTPRTDAAQQRYLSQLAARQAESRESVRANELIARAYQTTVVVDAFLEWTGALDTSRQKFLEKFPHLKAEADLIYDRAIAAYDQDLADHLDRNASRSRPTVRPTPRPPAPCCTPARTQFPRDEDWVIDA
jgi:hypothetical protein